MWRVYGGALAIIAGIAAFIEAHSHKPQTIYEVPREVEAADRPIHLGLSQTSYDLLRIGGWALVILGGVTVAVGLIGLWRRSSSGAL